jgi:co-chaperonin GroES (HSP10)
VKLNFKLFGDRVLLEKVAPKQGTIYIPTIDDKTLSKFGRVVAHGDGQRLGVTTLAYNGRYYETIHKPVKIEVEVGDICWFETNAMAAGASCYDMGGSILVNVMHGELIAKVKSTDVSLEQFQVLGDWILVRPFLREDEKPSILIPQAVQDKAQPIHFRVEKLGSTVDIPISPGDEVVMVHGRCRPIKIGNEDLGYVHKSEIHGTVEENRILSNN